MEFTIALGYGGWLLLLGGAVAFGVILQLIGDTGTGYEWLLTAAAAAIGALVASEFIVSMRTFEPVWDGLALVPALVGGLIVGGIVEVLTRFLTGGRYVHHPMAV